MNKIAFITGASAGIGKACAEIFAREGYNLVLTARRIDKLDDVAREIKAKYTIEVKTLSMDVRSKASVQEGWNSLPVEWRNVDLLINNAGLSQGLDPIYSGDTDDWDRMIDTNVKGLLYVSRTIIHQMKERKSGHVINIGSIAAKEVYPNGNVYCATKHAVDALNKAMRIDLLPYNVKVSALHPGAVETEFSIVRFKGDEERAKKVYEGFEPLIAMDIAEAAWFVVSRPQHVNINEMLIMPSAQANGSLIYKQ